MERPSTTADRVAASQDRECPQCSVHRRLLLRSAQGIELTLVASFSLENAMGTNFCLFVLIAAYT